MPSALGDLVVLDLSHALAGPFASTMLGDYGAEIIKIEPLDGEIARAWGPPFYGGESAYFVNLNRNKKSVAIDLKHPDGKAIFFRLLTGADVVLENLRVGTVARLGIRKSEAVSTGASFSMRSSAFTRLCACLALLALALKRSMNFCRWAMRSCCFSNADCCSTMRSARISSKAL